VKGSDWKKPNSGGVCMLVWMLVVWAGVGVAELGSGASAASSELSGSGEVT